MRRPREEFAPRRRAGWTVIGTPFGVFGGNRGGYVPRYRRGYGRGRPGGGCARDACLLESGCCLAEGLDGSCLLLALLAVPQLLVALVHPSAASGRPQDVLLRLIATYRRTVSARRRHPVCRYTPSCSAYAGQAVTRYGALRGSRLAAQRLLRCRPGAPGGADPVL